MIDKFTQNNFVPSREHALLRLENFIPKMGAHYEQFRNYDYGPDNRSNISLLSPYVTNRLILEEEVVSSALKAHDIKNAEKFIQEVFWRAYFKGWLELRPYVWEEYRESLKIKKEIIKENEDKNNIYSLALNGKTDYECFNFWVKELIETGYLHNHARMWFASIWIFYLGLPWELGADFFYRHLLDGDPASNTLSWRWVAGLHTNGKNYIATASNIDKFTNGRFNPENLKIPVSVNTKPLFSKHKTINQYIGSNTEISNQKEKTAILIYDNDLYIENSALKNCNPSIIFGLSSKLIQNRANFSNLVLEFKECALNDSLYRAKKHFNTESKIISSTDELNELTKVSKRVSFIRPRVGFWKELLTDVKDTNTDYMEIERPWDKLSYPQAKNGFFRFKKNISHLIQELNL